MVTQALRSALFYILFLGQTVILAIVLGILGLVCGRTGIGLAIARYWGNANLFFLRWIIGMRTEVSGAENIPPGGCIIASKHQSDWDVFAVLPFIERPAYIVKKELMRIPFFGWAARSLGCIEVDRAKGSEAIPDMLRQARVELAAGAGIIIFPEGTRRAPLAAPNYKYGLARMYVELGVPVVPVALNSGLFWGRNSLVLWPGRARAVFLPPIPAGLSLEEFQARLIETIETKSNVLALEAVKQGLTRPLTTELSERIAIAKQAEDGRQTTTY
ncbi:MAG TPA: lysophospholipid acyltransferase family protein [Devosiaceae bacterium]|jgi:1-acyl-sn-glycerol-3-phosphate acyltransferase